MSPQSHSFRIEGTHFLLDDQVIQLISGEIHYQRIPYAYWHHRLRAARAMGLNTVSVYMFWNQHEPKQGEFTFNEGDDVAQFCRIAQEEGLWVILRPGPYCCAEWDFGGLPPWLLADGNLRVRCNDPVFINAIRRYMARWAQELAPLQCSRGGPILIVQVENEYGSYGRDKAYLGAIRDALRENGFEVPFFTCDGPGDDMLSGGTLPDVLAGANFGDSPERNFGVLQKFLGGKPTPFICPEIYTGWFVHWRNRHLYKKNLAKSTFVMNALKWMLEHGASFSLYMFHGGTNFGFSAGANYFDAYKPDITSYDYDSPLTEHGRMSADYSKFREIFAKYQFQNAALPAPPEPPKMGKLPSIRFKESASLLKNLGKPVQAPQIRPMECFGQYYGLILYRTFVIPAFSGKKVRIQELHDYGHIFLDGVKIATLDRGLKQFEFSLPAIKKATGQLDILVESHGRVNYGAHLLDRKGITEFVGIGDRILFMDWDVFCLALDNNYLHSLQFGPDIPQENGPAFHRAEFSLGEGDLGDIFVDPGLYKKGMVWINSHNLGRFWEVGPQRRLYLPGCWLKAGENEIILLDMEGPIPANKAKKALNTEWKLVPAESAGVNFQRPPIRGTDTP